MVAATTEMVNPIKMADCWERFISWTMLRRVVTLYLIYYKRLLDISAKRDQQNPLPAPKGIDILIKTEYEIIKLVQQFAYAEGITSSKLARNSKSVRRKDFIVQVAPVCRFYLKMCQLGRVYNEHMPNNKSDSYQ